MRGEKGCVSDEEITSGFTRIFLVFKSIHKCRISWFEDFPYSPAENLLPLA